VVLTSLSKHTRKNFQIIIAFVHSAFIIQQSIFVLRNMVLKRYLACRTFSKCQPYSNESTLSIRTYTYIISADNQLHNCVCGALSIKDGGVINIIASCDITADKNDWVAVALMILYHNVKWLNRNQYRTFCAENNIVNCSIIKKLLSKYNAWLMFCSDNATTISEASCGAFYYEKFVGKI